jgi:Zn-dependent protease with chaperone function
VRISVYIPLAVAAVLAVVGPALARWLHPRTATWALTGAALVAAGGWLGALALLASTLFGQIPQVAFLGAWSIRALRAQDPVAHAVSAACAAALLCTTATLGAACWRHGRALMAAFRECRAMPGSDELAVVDAARVEAFALPGAPGSPGRVVVSTGMLQVLDGSEREALLAHERAHLRGRHHFLLLALQLAAAACPLLYPLAREGAFCVERWADEEAAAAVGDRAVVGRAVALAALAATGNQHRTGLLAATGGPVPRRVRALFAPPAPPRRMPLLVITALVALCCTSLADATQDATSLFGGAHHAYSTAHTRFLTRHDLPHHAAADPVHTDVRTDQA